MSARLPFALGSLPGFLKGLSSRRGTGGPAISSTSFVEDSAGLEADYSAAIRTQLVKVGIDPRCVEVRVCTVGQTSAGYDIVAGFLTLVKWDKSSGMRLILGIPSLEKRVRRFAAATWLADYSTFSGLWLSIPDKLDTSGELKALLRQTVAGQGDSLLA